IFSAVVVLPLGEFLLALSILHRTDEGGGRLLGSSVAQRIQADGVRDAGEGVALLGLRKHRRLAVHPRKVAEKNQHEQRTCAGRDIDVVLGEPHVSDASLGASPLANKVTLVRHEGTCTAGARNEKVLAGNRHRGTGRPASPATPPYMRVRIRRFGG